MGQIFNDYAPNIWARQPQLQRILWAYKASQMVHEHLVDYTQEKHANRTLFTSHEGLHLPYESSLTQQCQDSNGYYNLSSHFQWVGMRSLFEDSAHIEFYRGIENPIGIKVGPSATPALLDQVCTVLNPRNVPGKVTLILRLGDKVSEVLPNLIKQVKSKGHKVIWVSDPMHANTVKNAQGVKTRSLDKIKAEVKQVSQILRENHCYFAGLHLEASPDNIYECADSCDLMAKVDLGKAYQTQCDPRLNFEQAINVVSCFINHSKKGS
jgi:3-deoxy-7-phosphoheptulonate synthase